MATIYYEITNGEAPFTASINPAVAPDNHHSDIGDFYFTDIPDGNYYITITDNKGCTVVLNTEVACDTIYTAEFIDHTCVQVDVCDCDTTMTVGYYTDGESFEIWGYVREPLQGIPVIGSLSPDCEEIIGLLYTPGVIYLFLYPNMCCSELIVEIDGIEYTLQLIGQNEQYCMYGAISAINPFPAEGETCAIKICDDRCITTTSTTTEEVITTTTTTTSTCNSSYCDYGILYNWYTINTEKLAPTGWHVPSSAEFETLRLYIASQGWNYDGTTDEGTSISNKQGKALASTCLWAYYSGTGTIGNSDYPNKRNISEFTVLPGGVRGANNGIFSEVNVTSIFWTSTENSVDSAYGLYLSSSATDILTINYNKNIGASVRCVRDIYEGWESDIPVVDYDGNEYDVIELGTQLWLVQNLKVTHYIDGEVIPNVEDNAAWAGLTTGALCAYNNDWETYVCISKPTTTTTTTEEPIITTTSTTSECIRPESLTDCLFTEGYLLSGGEWIYFSNVSVQNSCENWQVFREDESEGGTANREGEIESLTIGKTAYQSFDSTECFLIPDGYYWFTWNIGNPSTYYYTSDSIKIVTVINGIITAIDDCEYLTTTTTTSTTQEPTTTTTTVETPVVYPLTESIYCSEGLGCSVEEYPFTYDRTTGGEDIFPPYFIKDVFSPAVLWTDIEYIEVMTVTRDPGITIKYNGVTVSSGMILTPNTQYYWDYPVIAIVDEFDCVNLYETWGVRVKLYEQNISNTEDITLEFDRTNCLQCTTTTTTTT